MKIDLCGEGFGLFPHNYKERRALRGRVWRSIWQRERKS